MLSYEGFGLPEDGLTRCEEIDRYGSSSLYKQGWTLVGTVSVLREKRANECDDGATEKIFGVFRKTQDQALLEAIERANKLEEGLYKLKTELSDSKKANEGLTSALSQANMELADYRQAAEDTGD